MIQDFCLKNEDQIQLIQFEEEAVRNLKIGTVLVGEFNLTLREAMNKIIHSTSAEIQFIEKNIEGKEYQYWDGNFYLKGVHNKKEWQLELHINSWAQAVTRYLESLDSNETIFYLGQDWA